MAKRIDYNGIIDNVYQSKLHGSYQIKEYIKKDEINKQHKFLIKFTDTKNEQYISYDIFKKNSVKDKGLLKSIAKKKQIDRLDQNLKINKNKKNSKFNLANIKNKRILALDLATHKTGISYYNSKQIEKSGVIAADKKETNYYKRIYQIVKKVEKIIKKLEIEVILIEGTYLSRNSNIKSMLDAMRGSLMYVALKSSVRVEVVPINAWKSHYNMPRGREEQKKFVMEEYRKETGEVPLTDDQCDAYFILKYCIEK